MLAFLFGSWLRAITTFIVTTNLVLVALATALLMVKDSKTLFRVDAEADQIDFVTTTPLAWGRGPIQAREGEEPLCAEASLDVPPGAPIQVRRARDGTSVSVSSSSGAPVIITCSPEDIRQADFVQYWFAVPRLPLKGSKKPLASHEFLESVDTLMQLPSSPAAIPVSGELLRIGGSTDPASLLTDAPLLRRGTLSSETFSWPLSSSSVIVNRALHEGEIVSFDYPMMRRTNRSRVAPVTERKSPPFTGLLLVSGNEARIIARTQSVAAYVTEPNASQGKPVIVAPTLLVRLQAQAEWAIFLLIGGLALNILAALRSIVTEDSAMFAWTKAKRATGGLAYLAVGVSTLAFFSSSDADAQSIDHPVFQISSNSGVGQGFAILNPKGVPHCLVVTVAHVAQPGDDIILTGEEGNPANAQPQRITTSAQYLDVLAPGLVILEPSKNAQLGDCPPMPMPVDADQLLDSDDLGRLTYAEESGERRTIRVVQDGNPTTSRPLSITSIGGPQISPGLSGSPFSMRGNILALANEVINGIALLTRIDRSTLNARYVAAPPKPVGAWLPSFGIDRLPTRYQKVAEAARELVNDANNVAKVAKSNAQQADEAVVRARASAQGYGIASLKEKDRIFEGQISANGTPEGFGVLRMTDGPNIGDESKGYFRRDDAHFSLSGAAVQTYTNPKIHSNQVKMEIAFSPGWNGPGILTFANGDIWWSSWDQGNLNGVATIRRASDQSVFEVTVRDGNWNGPGIRWSKNGQPLCVCIWKDGKVVENETDKVITASR